MAKPLLRRWNLKTVKHVLKPTSTTSSSGCIDFGSVIIFLFNEVWHGFWSTRLPTNKTDSCCPFRASNLKVRPVQYFVYLFKKVWAQSLTQLFQNLYFFQQPKKIELHLVSPPHVWSFSLVFLYEKELFCIISFQKKPKLQSLTYSFPTLQPYFPSPKKLKRLNSLTRFFRICASTKPFFTEHGTFVRP